MIALLERVDRSALRVSLAAGVAVALVLAVAGLAYAATQQRTYTAESVLVVLPDSALDTATSAAYYETLSRGQVVATFAEIAGNLRFEQQAEQRLQVPEAQRDAITTEVSVVPDTAVILFRVTAEDAGLAEQVADTSTTIATEYLTGLSKPYRTDLVQAAGGTAYQSSTSRGLLIVAALLVALVAGLAIQQAIYHLRLTILPPNTAANASQSSAGTTPAVEPPVWT